MFLISEQIIPFVPEQRSTYVLFSLQVDAKRPPNDQTDKVHYRSRSQSKALIELNYEVGPWVIWHQWANPFNYALALLSIKNIYE